MIDGMLELIMHTAFIGLMVALVTATVLFVPMAIGQMLINRHVDKWVRTHLLSEQTKERIN